MPRLMLLRHAKSDWPDGVSDLDRPLARRGREAAPPMGAYMAREGLRPDLVLVSPARRTRETLERVRESLGGAQERVVPGLYDAPARRILDAVRDEAGAAGTVLVVGHNPGVQDAALALAGEGGAEAMQRLRAKYPTAGLAVLDLPGEDWGPLANGACRLERFVTPKSIGAGEDD